MNKAEKIVVYPIGCDGEVRVEYNSVDPAHAAAKLDAIAELCKNHVAIVYCHTGGPSGGRYFRLLGGRKSVISYHEFYNLAFAAYRVVITLQVDGNTIVDYYAQKSDAYTSLGKIRDEYVKGAVLSELVTNRVIARGAWATGITGRPIAWLVTNEDGSLGSQSLKQPDSRPPTEAPAPAQASAVSLSDLVNSGVPFPFVVRKVTEDEHFGYQKGAEIFPIGKTLAVIGRHETEQDTYKAVDFVNDDLHVYCNVYRRQWVLLTNAKAASKPHPENPSSMANIIGLDSVKDKIREIVAKYKLSITHSLETSAPKMVFAGNPGTGKTTVASDVAYNLCQIGVLRSPVVKFVSGADLKARYVGHTAPHINKIFDDIESAGQLLFIDEIYSLFSGDGADMTESASDAVGTLLTRIERLAKGSAIVLAGYPDKLRDFFAVNQGLISRLQDVVIFKDFTVEESLAILNARLKTLHLSTGTQEEAAAIEPVMLDLVSSLSKEPSFANGRTIRNLAEHVFRRLAVRLDGKTDPGDTLVVQASDFAGFLDSGSILSMLAGEIDAKKETARIGFFQ